MTKDGLHVCVCDLDPDRCFLVPDYFFSHGDESITSMTPTSVNHSHCISTDFVVVPNKTKIGNSIGFYSILDDTSMPSWISSGHLLSNEQSIIDIPGNSYSNKYCLLFEDNVFHGDVCFDYIRTSNVSLFIPFNKIATGSSFMVHGSKVSDDGISKVGFVTTSAEDCSSLPSLSDSDQVFAFEKDDISFDFTVLASSLPNSGTNMYWCAWNEDTETWNGIGGIVTEIVAADVTGVQPNTAMTHGRAEL
jgi:hypothetical protein